MRVHLVSVGLCVLGWMFLVCFVHGTIVNALVVHVPTGGLNKNLRARPHVVGQCLVLGGVACAGLASPFVCCCPPEGCTRVDYARHDRRIIAY